MKYALLTILITGGIWGYQWTDYTHLPHNSTEMGHWSPTLGVTVLTSRTTWAVWDVAGGVSKNWREAIIRRIGCVIVGTLAGAITQQVLRDHYVTANEVCWGYVGRVHGAAFEFLTLPLDYLYDKHQQTYAERIQYEQLKQAADGVPYLFPVSETAWCGEDNEIKGLVELPKGAK